MMKKGQTWSTDAVVAVILFFTSAILLFYLAGPAANNKETGKLQSESNRFSSTLSSENFTLVLVKGTQIEDEDLGRTINFSYESLKGTLGVNSEFCIYLEDSEGNLIPMQGKVGIGSSFVNISGKGCNESVAAG